MCKDRSISVILLNSEGATNKHEKGFKGGYNRGKGRWDFSYFCGRVPVMDRHGVRCFSSTHAHICIITVQVDNWCTATKAWKIWSHRSHTARSHKRRVFWLCGISKSSSCVRNIRGLESGWYQMLPVFGVANRKILTVARRVLDITQVTLVTQQMAKAGGRGKGVGV